MALPSASSNSPSLILARATPDERVKTWMRHQPFWGSIYTPQAYVDREEQLLTCRLTRDSRLTTWILTQDTNSSSSTTTTAAAATRPILSSLETYRKRAIVRDTTGTVRDVTAHGVATVFTSQHHRRKGYSSKMLSLLGDRLAHQQSQEQGSAEFSVLFSDIGKTFYAQNQWMPFPSTHLSFPVSPFTTKHDSSLTPITNDNLPMVAELDERVLRDKLAAPPAPPNTVRVAILPDLATYEWHFAREAILSSHLLGKVPSIHGALYTPAGLPGSRVWMLWSPSVSGGREDPGKNVMNILHFAIEDDDIPDDELANAFESIMGLAHTQAREWLCPKIDMWNPDERTQKLARHMVNLRSELVVRETSCIASLRWFGEGSVSAVEWVDNQKFEWC